MHCRLCTEPTRDERYKLLCLKLDLGLEEEFPPEFNEVLAIVSDLNLTIWHSISSPKTFLFRDALNDWRRDGWVKNWRGDFAPLELQGSNFGIQAGTLYRTSSDALYLSHYLASWQYQVVMMRRIEQLVAIGKLYMLKTRKAWVSWLNHCSGS